MQKKPSALLVMEDRHLERILLRRFSEEGFVTERAENEADAVKRAVKLRPEIFFVEVMPHDKDLKKHVKHWKSLPTLLKAKIVLLFPKAERAHVDEALEAGANRVILSGSLSPKEMVKSLL